MYLESEGRVDGGPATTALVSAHAFQRHQLLILEFVD